MLWNILKIMFAWPQGIVVGNLIASLIWATPAFIHLHMRINKHHKEMKERTKNGSIGR